MQMKYKRTVYCNEFFERFTQGCHTAIADWFNQHEYIVGILSVVIMLQASSNIDLTI